MERKPAYRESGLKLACKRGWKSRFVTGWLSKSNSLRTEITFILKAIRDCIGNVSICYRNYWNEELFPTRSDFWEKLLGKKPRAYIHSSRESESLSVPQYPQHPGIKQNSFDKVWMGRESGAVCESPVWPVPQGTPIGKVDPQGSPTNDSSFESPWHGEFNGVSHVEFGGHLRDFGLTKSAYYTGMY